MIKILIAGADSYIGVSFENYIKNYSNDYSVDTIDLTNSLWSKNSFKHYDVIVHVAGIAHIKETKENADNYYKVNRDLSTEVAKKAKADGVKQFIYLSSMSIYGKEIGSISEDTVPNPKTNYGRSKLQAEENLLELQSEIFKVAILRPPMVYGKGCKGNYQTLRSFVLKYRLFPSLKNKRSMIYIDNLSLYIKKIIDTTAFGIFLPQNSTFVCTLELVQAICNANKVKLTVCPILNIIKLFPISPVKKVFGDLTYTQIDDLSNQGIDFEKTIELSERN